MVVFTDEERMFLNTCSIERTINTTLKLASFCEKQMYRSSPFHAELGSENRQDWEMLKPIILKLWHAACLELEK